MERRVVVVGAGLAGLSCARRLADTGVAVVIVESESIGGRVKQASHNGESYELGAEFLHGGAASAKILADACGARTSRVFTAAHGDGGPDDDAASAGSGECSIEILRFLELERQHTESEGAPAGRARRDRPRPANIPLA